MRISLKDNWKIKVIKKIKVYFLKIKNKQVVDTTFDELHTQDDLWWINSQTSFSYSVFVVWKTLLDDTRKNRFVVDIRDLNQLIQLDVYLISLQSDIISVVRRCKFITIIDVATFFYQWRVHLDNQHKLIVITHRDQNIFKILVMSCKNSSTYVQRQIDRILRLHHFFVKTYVDDVVIFFVILKKHLQHLHTIFDLFSTIDISIKSIKAFFNFSDVQLLEQHVDFLELFIFENKLAVIVKLKFSKTLKEFETYLEFTNWLRQYVSYYAKLEKALKARKINLLKSDLNVKNVRKFYFVRIAISMISSVEQTFFDALQVVLFKSTYLIHFDSLRQLYVNFNAFKERDFEALVFHVKKADMNFKKYSSCNLIEFILFLSRLLISIETRYWSIKLEVSDFVWVLKKIRHMIEFTFKIILYSNYDLDSLKIIVYTNHAVAIEIAKQNTLFIFSTNKLNLRLVRAFEFFSRFNFDIHHKSRKKHIVSNALSRLASVNYETELKNNDELNILFVYNTTLVELSQEFREKILTDYIFDISQIIVEKILNSNAVLLSFERELKSLQSEFSSVTFKSTSANRFLIYHVDRLIEVHSFVHIFYRNQE